MNLLFGISGGGKKGGKLGGGGKLGKTGTSMNLLFGISGGGKTGGKTGKTGKTGTSKLRDKNWDIHKLKKRVKTGE